MQCTSCSSTETKVLDKRETDDKKATRRRRECLVCQKRFTTYERIEPINIRVIKKNSTREQFDRDKIIKGILKACEKRPVTKEEIEKAAAEVEDELIKLDSEEVHSNAIGEIVMKKLRKLDKVAYIRFASVYREFADLKEFEAEISRLLKK
jgi:transcriptional repressor NrdR